MLILDEPSTGLDPLARRDILAAVLRTVADEGRTVVFSSHLLDEVERVSDHIAMLDQGRVIVQGPLDDVRAAHRVLTVQLRRTAAAAAAAGRPVRLGRRRPRMVGACRRCRPPRCMRRSRPGGARVVEERSPSLDRIFVARVGRRHEATVEG